VVEVATTVVFVVLVRLELVVLLSADRVAFIEVVVFIVVVVAVIIVAVVFAVVLRLDDVVDETIALEALVVVDVFMAIVGEPASVVDMLVVVLVFFSVAVAASASVVFVVVVVLMPRISIDDEVVTFVVDDVLDSQDDTTE
jgi:hypothetical protein